MVKNTLSKTAGGVLPAITKYIERNFNRKAEDYVAEMLRIDEAVKAEFPNQGSRYSKLFVVCKFRNILYLADQPRRIGYLYEALVAALLQHKTLSNDEMFMEWSSIARKEGFRNVNPDKLREAYDQLTQREEFKLKPRSEAHPPKKKLIDVIEATLNNSENGHGDWRAKNIDINMLIEQLAENEGIKKINYRSAYTNIMALRQRESAKRGREAFVSPNRR